MDRLLLQTLLEELLGTDKVYYQPPSNVSMVHPCIVYHKDGADTTFADNAPYKIVARYTVTIVSRDPDSVIPWKIAQLPMCTFNDSYVADNLNHDVFTLYF